MLRGAWEVPAADVAAAQSRRACSTTSLLAAGLGEPIATQAAGWADYDNDGRVDLYVAGEFDPSRPTRATAAGSTTTAATARSRTSPRRPACTNDRFGKGVAWGDYDDDGRPDLYVSNLGQANRLYHNQGDGTFIDVAAVLGVTGPSDSFACWFWDYDNDGRLDLWVNPNRATLSEVIATSSAGRRRRAAPARIATTAHRGPSAT